LTNVFTSRNLLQFSVVLRRFHKTRKEGKKGARSKDENFHWCMGENEDTFLLCFEDFEEIMASYSVGTSSPPSISRISGHNAPAVVVADPSFVTLCKAYKGRNKKAFDRGQRSSEWEPRDTFLKLVHGEISVGNPVDVLGTAIAFCGENSAIVEEDIDLPRKITKFLWGYGLISETQFIFLEHEALVRQKDKRALKTARRFRDQQSREAEAERKRAKQEDEEWEEQALAEVDMLVEEHRIKEIGARGTYPPAELDGLGRALRRNGRAGSPFGSQDPGDTYFCQGARFDRGNKAGQGQGWSYQLASTLSGGVRASAP
jgi:hypothetical protein